MAPLLFLALALAAQGSVEASPALWLAALVALAAAFSLMPPGARPAAFTPLAILVVFLAAWMAATNKWVNPSYTAAAPYHAAFLFGGFLLGRRAGAENAERLFGAAVAFAICLAGWALWQRTQGEARAHALFETPATLAAAINLVLLPGLVLVLSGKGRALLIAMLVVCIAALFAAGSRGGWLGLAVGGLVAYGVGRRSGLRAQPKAWLLLLGMFAIAWGLSALAPIGAGPGQAQAHSMLAGDATLSSVARLELYELAWRANAPASLLTGIGYLGYYYLVEAGRAGIATYEQSITYFVHNDYLQTLLELGVPGLLGLLGIAGGPLIAARRLAPKLRSAPADRLMLVALAGALGSMVAHAMVDFPFYIPVCLLMYGSALGLLDSMLLRDAPPLGIRARGAVVAGAATLAVWILVMPVAAQAAAGYAHRQWRAAYGESTAYWFEVARRLEPRDWRYHWYAGQFWFAEAALNRKPEAARLAERAFADGYAANAREVRNLLGLIATHRDLRPLLVAPADGPTLRKWSERAAELAPKQAR